MNFESSVITNFSTAMQALSLNEPEPKASVDLQFLQEKEIVDTTGQLVEPSRHPFNPTLTDQAKANIQAFLSEEITIGRTLEELIHDTFRCLQHKNYYLDHPRVSGYDLCKLLGNEQLVQAFQAILPANSPPISLVERRTSGSVSNLLVTFSMQKFISPQDRHNFVESLNHTLKQEFGEEAICDCFARDTQSHYSGFRIIYSANGSSREITFVFSTLLQHDFVVTAEAVQLALPVGQDPYLVDYHIGSQWAIDNVLGLVRIPPHIMTGSYSLICYLTDGFVPANKEHEFFWYQYLQYNDCELLLNLFRQCAQEPFFSLDRKIAAIHQIAHLARDFGNDPLADTFYYRARYELLSAHVPSDVDHVLAFLDICMTNSSTHFEVDLVKAIDAITKNVAFISQFSHLYACQPGTGTSQKRDICQALTNFFPDTLQGYLAQIMLYRTTEQEHYLEQIIRHFPHVYCSSRPHGALIARLIQLAIHPVIPWHLDDVDQDEEQFRREWLAFFSTCRVANLRNIACNIIEETTGKLVLTKERIPYFLAKKSDKAFVLIQKLQHEITPQEMQGYIAQFPQKEKKQEDLQVLLKAQRFDELLERLLQEPKTNNQARQIAKQALHACHDPKMLTLLSHFGIVDAKFWKKLLQSTETDNAWYAAAIKILSELGTNTLSADQKAIWKSVLENPTLLIMADIAPREFKNVHKSLYGQDWEKEWHKFAPYLTEAAVSVCERTPDKRAAYQKRAAAWICASPEGEKRTNLACRYTRLDIPVSTDKEEFENQGAILVAVLRSQKQPKITAELLSRQVCNYLQASHTCLEVAKAVCEMKLHESDRTVLEKLLLHPLEEVQQLALPALRERLVPLQFNVTLAFSSISADILHFLETLLKQAPVPVLSCLFSTLIFTDKQAPSKNTRLLGQQSYQYQPPLQPVYALLARYYERFLALCESASHPETIRTALDVDFALTQYYEPSVARVLRSNLTDYSRRHANLFVLHIAHFGWNEATCNLTSRILTDMCIAFQDDTTSPEVEANKRFIRETDFILQRDDLQQRRYYFASATAEEACITRFYPAIAKSSASVTLLEKVYLQWQYGAIKTSLSLLRVLPVAEVKKRAHLFDYCADTLQIIIGHYPEAEGLLQIVNEYVTCCQESDPLFTAHSHITAQLLRACRQRQLDTVQLTAENNEPLKQIEAQLNPPSSNALKALFKEIHDWQSGYPINFHERYKAILAKLFEYLVVHPEVLPLEFLDMALTLLYPNGGRFFGLDNDPQGKVFAREICSLYIDMLLKLKETFKTHNLLNPISEQRLNKLAIFIKRTIAQGVYDKAFEEYAEIVRKICTLHAYSVKELLLFLAPLRGPDTLSLRLNLIEECLEWQKNQRPFDVDDFVQIIISQIIADITPEEQDRCIRLFQDFAKLPESEQYNELVFDQLRKVKKRYTEDQFAVLLKSLPPQWRNVEASRPKFVLPPIVNVFF